ncbi:hypothetical protein N646_2973 [Vibrio alginolyticus NBRC 15630 = ATCC 17749]|uniref:Uncharacterized protein n=1 Tax=Vibrio alginolyticus (strain ATCC 17749 / DSM 2171 / NBRC 15630 / NCIMB 1903 / NCTC 12160 / XII-53) TaxID=1219076 RepID=A0A2I3CI48_VIBAX|nr:hypothetical protein N646_2973 [Vibrio alginolyticus NBRC 15630 = ATCC 17749]
MIINSALEMQNFATTNKKLAKCELFDLQRLLHLSQKLINGS